MSEWIDISLPVRHAMVHWPDNPDPVVEQIADMRAGSVCNLTRIAFSAHTGTHMDAMRHFVADGITMEKMPLDAVIGPARVIEVPNAKGIYRAEIEHHNFQPGERILFKTTNSALRWDGKFHEDYVALENDAAQLMVECGVRTVGIDTLSVAPWHDLISTHVTLLSAGIWIIEGLDFRGVDAGDYDLVCLPLKIEGSDGAPARAVIRPRA